MSKKLLVFALLFVLLSVSIVTANGRRLDYVPVDKLNLNCYQEKCEAEKDLWDSVNSRCVFTPKVSYKEDIGNVSEFGSFLNKKLGQGEISRDEYLNTHTFFIIPSFPNYPSLLQKERSLLLEFQCGEASLTFGSENCNESFTDNFLLLMDKDFLKLDLSFDEKNRIKEIYSSCLASKTLEEVEQLRKEKTFLLISFLLFLFISGGLILGNWVYHIKEERAFDYLIHGVLGFLMGIMHVFISFFIFGFLNMWEIYWLPYLIFLLSLIGGWVYEIVSYIKTKKLFWIYTLIFSMLTITYLIILRTYIINFIKW